VYKYLQNQLTMSLKVVQSVVAIEHWNANPGRMVNSGFKMESLE